MPQHPSRRLSWGVTSSQTAHVKDDASGSEDEADAETHSSASSSALCEEETSLQADVATQPDSATTPADASAPSIQYDSEDHTRAFTDAEPPRMIVLPRALMPASVQTALGKGDDDDAPSSGPALRETTVNMSNDSTTCQQPSDMTKCAPGSLPALESYDEENGGLLLPGVQFVQLPHPRHRQPALFLCSDTAHNIDSTSVAEGEDVPCVYEVQAQDPPGGFAQTWCVDDVVIPGSSQLLVSTPFDVTFFALRELIDAQARSRGSFQPVTQLFCESDVPSRRQDTNEDEGDKRCKGQEKENDSAWWPGWATAVNDCPELLPCYTRMQSHTVLARLCEVRRLPGAATTSDSEPTMFYRYDERAVIEWLLAKIKKVEDSAVLAEMLQLPKPTERARTRDELEALRTMAFHAVIEYVPQSLHMLVAQRYGLDAELASIEPKAPSQTGSHTAHDTAQTRHTSAASALGEKRKADVALARTSARRLEKAGRPKDTPTLFTMFAQQASKKSKEEQAGDKAGKKT